jgi:hypothetical protein
MAFSLSFTDCHRQINTIWYGGDWINKGLLNCVAIDRKPKNDFEIQNAACSKTGIMMELPVVKGPVEEHLVLENDDDDELQHGCKVMLHLLRFWTSAKCHIVCADSYFASVQAACRHFDLNFGLLVW